MLWLILNQKITLGEFFSLFIYSFFIFTPLTNLSAIASQYQESRASLEQFEEILKTQSDPKPKHPRSIESLEVIEFKKVFFLF